MTWTLTGKMVESCSCNMMCPCWYGVKELMKMDRGWCDSAFLFQANQGKSDGVDLSGRMIALAIDLPGPTMFDGQGTGRLYVDDGSSPAQRREFEAIFQGKKGGPWQALGGLFTKWLPTLSTKITVKEDDGQLDAAVGSFGHVRSKLLKNEAGQVVTLQNAGLAVAMGAATVELAPSTSEWRDPEMPRTFRTDSGAVGKFTWKG